MLILLAFAILVVLITPLVLFRQGNSRIIPLMHNIKWSLEGDRILKSLMCELPASKEHLEALEIDNIEAYLYKIKETTQNLLKNHGFSIELIQISLPDEFKLKMVRAVTRYYDLDLFSEEILYCSIDNIISEYKDDGEIRKLLRRIGYIREGSIKDRIDPSCI